MIYIPYLATLTAFDVEESVWELLYMIHGWETPRRDPEKTPPPSTAFQTSVLTFYIIQELSAYSPRADTFVGSACQQPVPNIPSMLAGDKPPTCTADT